MRGGEITGNTATGYGWITSGGVFVIENGGVFLMHDGVIAGNTAVNNDGDLASGGGVDVGSHDGNNAIFRMSGEIIHGDDAPGGLETCLPGIGH